MFIFKNIFSKNTIEKGYSIEVLLKFFLSSYSLKLSFIVVATFISHVTFGQAPTFYLNFDEFSFEEVSIPKSEALWAVDIQQSQFIEGLKGRSLDLSANAMLRRPVKLIKEQLPSFDEKTSFSVQIWVKTIPNAKMGTPIFGNKKANDLETSGWQLYTKENGAWSLVLNDGGSRYDYTPTAERQRINDGEWHQLVFSVDRLNKEVWIYLDGKNVAIYNTPDLKSLESDFATVIGGCGADEEWTWGYYGQWYAFNGFIDEVKVWDIVLDDQTVENLYYEFYPKTDEKGQSYEPKQLKVLSWNIWHGGHRHGKEVGLERVIDIIKSSNSDVIGLIETYGSGAIIADSLGYYYYLISPNLSIMSRYPIAKTIRAFRPSNFGGVKLKLSPTKNLIFFDTWLHYLPDFLKTSAEAAKTPNALIADEKPTRYAEIKQILKEIRPYLESTSSTPVIMAGDFNVGSHLDWTKETMSLHYNKIVEWPVSKELEKMGFKDSYRELYINPLTDPGFTWTPRAATSSDKYGLRDRIDFIYYKGAVLNPIMSKVIDYHPVIFPSDHAAVTTVFVYKEL